MKKLSTDVRNIGPNNTNKAKLHPSCTTSPRLHYLIAALPHQVPVLPHVLGINETAQQPVRESTHNEGAASFILSTPSALKLSEKMVSLYTLREMILQIQLRQ